MRRIFLLLILIAVVVVAGMFLIKRPKSTSTRRPRASTQTDSLAQKTTAARPAARGKTVGKLKAQTKEERAKERKRQREEEKRRRKELRRQERERRRMLKYSSRLRKGKKRGSKGAYYVLKAIVSLGDESYALIDNRRVKVGDVVMGRKIVAIYTNHIEIEAFGRRSVVRVCESLLPTSYFMQRKQRV
ncbi:MAG: hypothetical protein ABIK18_05765 [candidate division WOR-3 bacterium]